MIKAFLKRGARKFGARYNYDPGYMLHVTDISTEAGLRLAALPFFAGYRKPPAAALVYAGAALASTLDGDCGPCVQLVVDMAIEGGVPREAVTACLRGSPESAGETGLGFRFAQAAIADTPELDALRAEIEALHGKEAVVAASFASASGRVYPVLKRGLGFGAVCAKVRIGNDSIGVTHPA